MKHGGDDTRETLKALNTSNKRIDLVEKLAKCSRSNRTSGDGFLVLGDEPNAIHVDGQDNDWIPAGYTYLAQFVAHDLTHRPAEVGSSAKRKTPNLSSPSLDLDHLYGGGPDASRHLYQGSSGEAFPIKFKLGKTQEIDGKSFPEDVPRISVDKHSEPLVADYRNDDNFIISQITNIFLRLHNSIVDKIQTNTMSRREVFEQARQLTIYCYREVVVHDLMFRWLDEQVYTQELSHCDVAIGPPHLLSEQDQLLFAKAAMRLGHLMIRNRYRINKTPSPPDRHLNSIINFARGKSPTTNINKPWRMDWSLFFPKIQTDKAKFGHPVGTGYNRSLRINLGYEYALNRPSANFLNAEVGALKEKGGLAFMDFWRSCNGELPNAQTLAFAKNQERIEPADIEKALNQLDSIRGDVSRLKQNTPLHLYFILESALGRSDGTRAGPLASRIIANNIRAGLHPLDNPRDLREQCRHVFGQARPPRWMSDVVYAALWPNDKNRV